MPQEDTLAEGPDRQPTVTATAPGEAPEPSVGSILDPHLEVFGDGLSPGVLEEAIGVMPWKARTPGSIPAGFRLVSVIADQEGGSPDMATLNIRYLYGADYETDGFRQLNIFQVRSPIRTSAHENRLELSTVLIGGREWRYQLFGKREEDQRGVDLSRMTEDGVAIHIWLDLGDVDVRVARAQAEAVALAMSGEESTQ